MSSVERTKPRPLHSGRQSSGLSWGHQSHRSEPCSSGYRRKHARSASAEALSPLFTNAGDISSHHGLSGGRRATPNLLQSSHCEFLSRSLDTVSQKLTRTQPFHVDQSDVVAMYVLSVAAQGGESRIASGAHIYNVIASTQPDVISVLAEACWPFHR